MRTVTDDKGWIIFNNNVRGRTCASCHFCCTHVPVGAPLNKAAGEDCAHLCSKGCSIYARRPDPCKAWSCTWLIQPDTADMKRPDIAGYAIDPMPQMVLIGHKPFPAIQVWVDAERPAVHRATALRAYLALAADKYGYVAIVRWSDGQKQAGREALILIAPKYNKDDNGWIEKRAPMISA